MTLVNSRFYGRTVIADTSVLYVSITTSMSGGIDNPVVIDRMIGGASLGDPIFIDALQCKYLL